MKERKRKSKLCSNMEKEDRKGIKVVMDANKEGEQYTVNSKHAETLPVATSISTSSSKNVPL